MINRQNYQDVKAFLRYQERVLQNSAKTIKRNRAHLRHLLEWCDATAFPRARLLTTPTFPAYLSALELAAGTIKHGLSISKAFFRFARVEWARRYKPITQTWIDTLTPPRHIANAMQPQREIYTPDDLLRIAAIQPAHLREQRAQAGACMLFVSGMRAGALASLPITAVDLKACTLHQLPELGVETKNSQAAITYLLRSLPHLNDIIMAWDILVRRELPENALWYATLTRDNSQITATTTVAAGRIKTIQDDIRLICALAGIPYRSPHKLRHGHAVYALKRAQDMKTWKAVSQNMMHSSTTTTDKIYGGLLDDDLRNVITNL